MRSLWNKFRHKGPVFRVRVCEKYIPTAGFLPSREHKGMEYKEAMAMALTLAAQCRISARCRPTVIEVVRDSAATGLPVTLESFVIDGRG